MAEDPALPLTDVQAVLGHAQLATTQIYLTPRAEDVIRRVLAHHGEQVRQARQRAGPPPAAGYRPGDAAGAVRDGELMTARLQEARASRHACAGAAVPRDTPGGMGCRARRVPAAPGRRRLAGHPDRPGPVLGMLRRAPFTAR